MQAKVLTQILKRKKRRFSPDCCISFSYIVIYRQKRSVFQTEAFIRSRKARRNTMAAKKVGTLIKEA